MFLGGQVPRTSISLIPLSARDFGTGEADDGNSQPILELLRVLDQYVPTPKRDVEKPFLMPVDKVFEIKGRGTVAASKIDRGIIKPGTDVEIVGLGFKTVKSVVTAVEIFGKSAPQAIAGDDAGILLRGVQRGQDIHRGQVIAEPGSVQPHTRFFAEVYVLTKEEGGRHKSFFSGYQPQFFMRTADVTGTIKLPDEISMVIPGDNVEMEVELLAPVVIEPEQRFAIREGGYTIGAGVVVKIIE